MFAVIGSLVMISNHYTLNGIKSRTVGDGQYGTARFATEKEIRETYDYVLYEPEQWRAGKHLPKEQGLVVGYKKKGNSITALVDSGDIHCLMIGAEGRVKVKGTQAKIARGEMVRWLSENQIEEVEKVKEFQGLGYRYEPVHSTASEMVFIKEKEGLQK